MAFFTYEDSDPMESLLRTPDVERRTGLKKSKLYALMALGQFPQPVKLTEKAVAWAETEVSAWIHAKISESRQGDESRPGGAA